MKIRQITHEEKDEAYKIIVSVTQWLNQNGIRQWVSPLPESVFRRWIENGFVYGVHDDNKIAAVFALRKSDLKEYELDHEGTVEWLSTVCVDREYAYKSLGSLILDFVKKQSNGDIYLDCVDNNNFLPSYYECHGFIRIKQANLYGRNMVLMKWPNRIKGSD